MNKGEVFNPKPKFEFLEITSLRCICVGVLKRRPRLFFFTVYEEVKEEYDSVHFYILRCARLMCCSSSDKFSFCIIRTFKLLLQSPCEATSSKPHFRNCSMGRGAFQIIPEGYPMEFKDNISALPYCNKAAPSLSECC